VSAESQAIPEAVRRQAEDLASVAPEPPAELGVVRVITDRYILVATPMPSVNFVERIRVEPDQLVETVTEVRETLRGLGRRQAAWTAGPSSRPTDLEERLHELGMTPYEDSPLEPTCTCMALVEPPDLPDDPRIVVEAVETLEQLRLATELETGAIGLSDEDAAAVVEGLETRFRLQQEGRSAHRVSIAYLDGVAVGIGRSLLLDAGINLSGAIVLPEARSRGVYRALVASRWQDAVERGTPALTVQAGTMSRPILERLGFVTVAVQSLLCDRF